MQVLILSFIITFFSLVDENWDESSSNEEVYDDDENDKDYQPYSPVIHESNSNESNNSTFSNQAQNTCKYNLKKVFCNTNLF